jgi:hypothetical protein
MWGHYKVSNNCELKGEMCFAKPLQSLWADYLVLQHMHSYLKPYGSVVLTVDLECQMGLTSKRLTYAGLKMLHPVTLQSLGQKLGSWQRAYPVLFFPKYTSVLFLNYVRFKWLNRFLGIQNRNNQFDLQKNKKLIRGLTEIIKAVEDFCSDRSLELKVIFLSSERGNADDSNDLLRALREICSDFHIVKNHEEVRPLLRTTLEKIA